MNIVLISTTDLSAGRSEALHRMLSSVARTLSTWPELRLALLLLLQKCSADALPPHDFPAFVKTSSIPHGLSLSAARNVLLSRARSRGMIESTTVVGFPDDDCWYPPGTLKYIVDQFSRAAELDLWLCRCSSDPVDATEVRAASGPARARHVTRHASSNTMFVRGSIIQSGIWFDEALGLGTPSGAAEDTDFALRAYISSEQTQYLAAAAVGHRDDPQRRAKYYRGALIAIARHAHKHRGIKFELMRKIAVGGWLILRGELSFTAFLGAISVAFNARRTDG